MPFENRKQNYNYENIAAIPDFKFKSNYTLKNLSLNILRT